MRLLSFILTLATAQDVFKAETVRRTMLSFILTLASAQDVFKAELARRTMRLLSFILTLASAQDVFKAETVIVNLQCIKSLALHDLAIFVILTSS